MDGKSTELNKSHSFALLINKKFPVSCVLVRTQQPSIMQLSIHLPVIVRISIMYRHYIMYLTC